MRFQDAFRTWAEGMGFVVKKQPPALQGDGDVYGVPLNRRRGWLYDAGNGMVGVDFRASSRAMNAAREILLKQPGFYLQTHAVDALLGRIAQADFSPILTSVLDAKRRRTLSPQAMEKAKANMVKARAMLGARK